MINNLINFDLYSSKAGYEIFYPKRCHYVTKMIRFYKSSPKYVTLDS